MLWGVLERSKHWLKGSPHRSHVKTGHCFHAQSTGMYLVKLRWNNTLAVFQSIEVLQSVPILVFWGPYAKLCRGTGDKLGMNKTPLSVFTPSRITLPESAWETVALPWLGSMLSTNFWFSFFLSRARDYIVSASDVMPTDCWLNVWCIWHT